MEINTSSFESIMASLESEKVTVDSLIKKLSDTTSGESLTISGSEVEQLSNWLEELRVLRDNTNISDGRVTLEHVSKWRSENEDTLMSISISHKNKLDYIKFMRDKVVEEIDESLEAYNKKDWDHVEDECGDVMNTVTGFIQALTVEPSRALYRGYDKLRRRLSVIRDGGTWDEAKKKHPR